MGANLTVNGRIPLRTSATASRREEGAGGARMLEERIPRAPVSQR